MFFFFCVNWNSIHVKGRKFIHSQPIGVNDKFFMTIEQPFHSSPRKLLYKRLFIYALSAFLSSGTFFPGYNCCPYPVFKNKSFWCSKTRGCQAAFHHFPENRNKFVVIFVRLYSRLTHFSNISEDSHWYRSSFVTANDFLIYLIRPV